MREIILNLTLKEILDFIIKPLCGIFLLRNVINTITCSFAKKKRLIRKAEKSICFDFIILIILDLLIKKEIIVKTFIISIIIDMLIVISRLGVTYYNSKTKIKNEYLNKIKNIYLIQKNADIEEIMKELQHKNVKFLKNYYLELIKGAE